MGGGEDAFYDRGITFPLKRFMNDGALQPKIVAMPILFRKMTFLYTWAVGLFIRKQFDFCWSQFSREVWSSLSEGPQKIQGEPLS